MNILREYNRRNNIIIYGHKGCGKSSRRAAFQKLYGKKWFLDELNADNVKPGNLPHDCLIITHSEPTPENAWIGTWISFDIACMHLKWSEDSEKKE